MSGREIARVTRGEISFAAVLLFALGAATPTLVSAAKQYLKPGGAFTGLNSATAGARTQKDLPVGQHALQLYSMATPNGQKVTIALEEMGLRYDAWYIGIMDQDQFTSGFVAVNPNSKIPAMVDKDGPGGKPVNLFESGSILLYLAEKSGKLLPKDPALRTECLNWLFFQVGAAPYFGQYGHFARYAPTKIKYGIDRYALETKRILSVLDQRLMGRTFLVGEELTIADLAWMPWVQCLSVFYKGGEPLGLSEYQEVMRWKENLLSRPAIAKGMRINSPAEENQQFKEYHSS
eukprot:TRINITY_DN1447_c0_g1_i2.p1 TRINITY_DN1447_c0_g1~~TRINITY_DN1447_c0_g1_i2.p1  ORF type:complete len:291 (-),score=97.94 TRINITY_DN1447_c0_g1_i2:247-1119(-)